jgi:fatty-acyl-CoA synthase
MTRLIEPGAPARRAAVAEPLLETTVGALLRRVAEAVPDRTALVEGVIDADDGEPRRWTYAELLDAAERVAGRLAATLPAGSRVALWAANSPEWVVAAFGVALARMVAVPVDPGFGARELERVLGRSGAAGVLHDRAHRGTPLADVLGEVAPRLPALELVLPIDAPELRAGAPGRLPDADPGDPVLMQFTSGTTGFPKGAQLHHRAVVNASRACARRTGFGDGDTWMNVMPVFHIAGGAVATLAALTHRGTQVIMPRFDPAATLRAIARERGSVILAVPTMLLAMLEHPDFAATDLTSLGCVLSGATAVPVELVEQVKREMGCAVSIVYGLTEMPILAQTRLDDSAEDQASTVGRAQENVELAIIDPVTLEPLGVGEPGEVWAHGFQTMTGYFRLPDETAAVVRPDGWVRTGDVGVLDERGFLRLTGRLKDMIIRGGENVYPKEIEDVVFGHPAVADVHVVGTPDPTWGEVVTAVVRWRPGHPPVGPAAMYAWCSERLAHSKRPVLWGGVEAFPLTPSGKVRKSELVRLVADGRIRVHAVGGRADAERWHAPEIPNRAETRTP